MNMVSRVKIRTACPAVDLTKIFLEAREVFKSHSRGIVHLREQNGFAVPYVRLAHDNIAVMQATDGGERLGVIHSQSGHLTWIVERGDAGAVPQGNFTHDQVRRFFLTHFKV